MATREYLSTVRFDTPADAWSATMTVHRTMPSEIEPDSLADLVADCSALPARLQPRPRTIDLAAVPHPRREVRVPALTAAVASGIADGYADYFV